MKLIIITIVFFLSFLCNARAAQKFWMGASGGAWSNGANWSGGTIPGASDSVIFASSTTVNVDISPSIATLTIAGGGNVIFSAAANRLITIGNNASGGFVFLVDVSSTLTLGQGAGVSIQTYGAGVSNTATIGFDAKLVLGEGNSQWIIAPSAASPSNCITDIYNQGIVEVAANNTAASAFSGSGTNNLIFSSGSALNWKRSGGVAPAADFQNGSLIDVTGIVGTNMSFSSLATYSGKLFWNCISQTISGASAILLPATNTAMDSIRVISTGTGTLRLATNPTGYSIGHLEVQGGTLELSAAQSSFRTGSVTTNLKMSGGTVIGNATFAGDVGGYPMTLTLGGSLLISGGTLNLTNRATGGAGSGAFQLNVPGTVSQTAGTITSTSAFGSQNYIMMNGAVSQNLQMNNATGSFSLVINNAAGVVMQSAVTLPYALVLISGVLTTTNTNLLTMAAGSVVASASNNSFVDGPVRKTGNIAFTFPVGKTNCGPSGAVKGYAALSISNFTGGAATDQFTVEYKRGDAMLLGAISNPGLHHISRCDYWTLTRDNGTSTVDIALSWNESINNCHATLPYINNLPTLTVAHHNNAGGTWDVIAAAGVTTGNATAGTVIWNGTQSATFGAFAIGSTNFQNPLPFTINYFTGLKQNGHHLLNWRLTCYSTPSLNITLERSSNARDYVAVHSIHATALQCQQPFNYTDANPAKGINYYRLKLTDANGKTTYSSVVSLINAASGIDILNISPNPVVGGTFSLKLSAAQKTNMELLITDMQGRMIQKQVVNAVAGFNQVPVDVRGLAAGTYQLACYSGEGRTRILRFVIQ